MIKPFIAAGTITGNFLSQTPWSTLLMTLATAARRPFHAGLLVLEPPRTPTTGLLPPSCAAFFAPAISQLGFP
jgi:hypothetical protein